MSLSKLSPTVYFLPSASKTRAPDAPSAILLFAWMGAPVRHMSKFIDYYRSSLFPDSPIVLTLSTSSGFFAKPNLRAALIEPAYTTFKSLQIEPSDVLVHIFSNGGLNAFHTFVSLTPTRSFSPRMLVIDSAPGKATLVGGVKAFTIDIQSRVKRFLMAIFIGLMLCLVKLKDKLGGKGSLMDRQRAWFLDGRAIDKSTKRLFLYSDGDDLVRSELVEEVITECEEKGYPVWSRNFGETRHVGHMRAKPDEYWNEIVQVWKE